MSEQSHEPIDVLLEVTRKLRVSESLENALQAAADAALLLLPGDHASIRLLDGERRELLSSARAGLGASRKPANFRMGQGVLGHVADTGVAALVEDTSTDARYEERPTGFSIRSLVAVPLMAAGRVVGVLSVSSAEPTTFKAEHLDLAQLLANCTVPSIETARLAFLAVTDDLTHAYNVRYFVTRIEEEISRARRHGDAVSLLMLDIDHFKKVNDRYGHGAGDEILCSVVARVADQVRGSDIVVRRGGDEFFVLMPATDEYAAHLAAERIRRRIGDMPFTLRDSTVIPLTTSIGAVTWQKGETAAELEARADKALYKAKEEGRNRTSGPV